MTFALKKQTATLANLNPRAETHGGEYVSAADIKIQFNIHNSDLVMFSPSLPGLLFMPADGDKSPNDPLPLVDDNPKPLTRLRFGSNISKLVWDYEMVGAQALIDFGTGTEKSNVKINASAVKNFSFVPMDGGTVQVSCTIQSSSLSESDFGKLSVLLRREITVTLNQSQQSLNLDDKGDKGKKLSDKKAGAQDTPFKDVADVARENAVSDALAPGAAAGAIPDPENVDVGDQSIVPPKTNDVLDPFAPETAGDAAKPTPKATPVARPKPAASTAKPTSARPKPAPTPAADTPTATTPRPARRKPVE